MLHCSNPIAPDDEEILAQMFGENLLNDERKQHLESCPICQQRLKDYQQIDGLLIPLYRGACPDTDKLTLYSQQLLSSEDEHDIEQHLYECPACSDEIAVMRSALANFTPFPTSIPVSSPPFLPRIEQVLKRVVAQLVPQPMLTVRHQFSSWPRHYQASAISLSLNRVQADHGKITLVGTFLGEQDQSFEAAQVDLYQLEHAPAASQADSTTEKPLRSTVVDQYDHFSFSSLAPGTYSIRISLPGTELLIEQIQLG